MRIVWRSDHEDWAVVEDEVELCRFPTLLAAERWVVEESRRREAEAL